MYKTTNISKIPVIIELLIQIAKETRNNFAT